MCANETRQNLSAVRQATEKILGIKIHRSEVHWVETNERGISPITSFSLPFTFHQPPTFEEWQSLYKLMHRIMTFYGNENENVNVEVICDWEKKLLNFVLKVKNIDPDEMAERFDIPLSN